MANEGFDWQCPHCERHAVIDSKRRSLDIHYSHRRGAEGYLNLHSRFIVCPNAACRKVTLEAWLFKSRERGDGEQLVNGGTHAPILEDEPQKHWNLIPQGRARVFPDYVPVAIREDYTEACSIVDLSPKAAATLARRALQGIARDYWKVRPGTLAAELGQVEDKVDEEIWGAIDAVRRVGNIGAHMERDINVIIDIDPGEARALIELVETLIDETYVARQRRSERASRVVGIAQAKAAAKSGPEGT